MFYTYMWNPGLILWNIYGFTNHTYILTYSAYNVVYSACVRFVWQYHLRILVLHCSRIPIWLYFHVQSHKCANLACPFGEHVNLHVSKCGALQSALRRDSRVIIWKIVKVVRRHRRGFDELDGGMISDSHICERSHKERTCAQLSIVTKTSTKRYAMMVV